MTTCPDLWLLLGVGASLLAVASWHKRRPAAMPPASAVPQPAAQPAEPAADGRSLGAA